MAITALNTIKNWFKTGLKPTQAQFWATWDSFWHKDQSIPQANITNLEQDLLLKQDKEGLHAVATSGDYYDLENLPDNGVVPVGEVLIFKRDGNVDPVLQENDLVIGFVGGAFIKGIYNASGDPTLLTSYNIIERIDF